MVDDDDDIDFRRFLLKKKKEVIAINIFEKEKNSFSAVGFQSLKTIPRRGKKSVVKLSHEKRSSSVFSRVFSIFLRLWKAIKENFFLLF